MGPGVSPEHGGHRGVWHPSSPITPSPSPSRIAAVPGGSWGGCAGRLAHLCAGHLEPPLLLAPTCPCPSRGPSPAPVSLPHHQVPLSSSPVPPAAPVFSLPLPQPSAPTSSTPPRGSSLQLVPLLPNSGPKCPFIHHTLPLSSPSHASPNI